MSTTEAGWKRRIGLLGREVVAECADGPRRGRLRALTWDELALTRPDGSEERLRPEAVKHLFVAHRGHSVGSVTISAGVAAYPEHGTTGETLVQAADAALYRAKNAGRDRVVVTP